MKIKLLVLLLFCTHLSGCVNKAKEESAANVVNDTAVVSDSVKHDVPDYDFDIISIEVLQPNLSNKKIRMGTEKPIYSTTIKHLTIWVDNNTDIPLDMGRNWSIEFWNGKEWVVPTMKKDLYWLDDARGSKETHMRYYFKYPIGEYYILKQGKYRIAKTFVQESTLIKLYADFEVR